MKLKKGNIFFMSGRTFQAKVSIFSPFGGQVSGRPQGLQNIVRRACLCNALCCALLFHGIIAALLLQKW